MRSTGNRLEEYNSGITAALQGKKIYENPHSGVGSFEEDLLAWWAGWCYGKKDLMEDLL